jgi:hypothetical protein
VPEAAQAGPDLLQADQGEEGLPQEQASDVLALPLQDFSHKGTSKLNNRYRTVRTVRRYPAGTGMRFIDHRF